jgi:hypothetical protein
VAWSLLLPHPRGPMLQVRQPRRGRHRRPLGPARRCLDNPSTYPEWRVGRIFQIALGGPPPDLLYSSTRTSAESPLPRASPVASPSVASAASPCRQCRLPGPNRPPPAPRNRRHPRRAPYPAQRATHLAPAAPATAGRGGSHGLGVTAGRTQRGPHPLEPAPSPWYTGPHDARLQTE